MATTAPLTTLAVLLLLSLATAWGSEMVTSWQDSTVKDLHKQYQNIFTHGNRNAASHLWASFLLDRAPHMTSDKLAEMFTGFCAVSGSPVHANDYKRYRLTLTKADDASVWVSGYMMYCCWPCVCDTQDFIKVDTKTIATADGDRQFWFAVIGNPCDDPAALHEPFVQPFDGRRTTLAREAPMVECADNGTLVGATLSDHGFPIISMYFDAVEVEVIGGGDAVGDGALVPRPTAAGASAVDQVPGRITEANGVLFQDEGEYAAMCHDRAENGYNSGMGEIFRKVAAISPIKGGLGQEQLPLSCNNNGSGRECDRGDDAAAV